MTRIDKYWKRSAAGLLAALMLMAGGRGMNFESFAMTSKTPFMEEAALQSPGTLVINDGQAAVQASQDILTPVQIGTDAGQAQAAAQTGQGAASGGTAQVMAFGAVSTPVTDSSSLFGAGRLTMYANHDTNAQSLSVIIETGQGGLIVVDGGWRANAEFLLNQIKQKGGHVQAS